MGERSVCVERQREKKKDPYFLRTGRKYVAILETIGERLKTAQVSENISKNFNFRRDIVKIGSCAFYNCTKMEGISHQNLWKWEAIRL